MNVKVEQLEAGAREAVRKPTPPKIAARGSGPLAVPRILSCIY